MYTNVLIGIDLNHDPGYERELHVAMNLAKDSMTRITALSVLGPIPSYVAEKIPADAIAAASDEAMTRLRNIVGQNSEIITEIRHGQAADVLLAYAEEHGIDCIVIASHTPGLKDYILGSTAARVVRHATCSVHVMRQTGA